MRNSFGFASPTPNVTRFLIAIIALFLVFALFGRSYWGVTVFNALLLDPYRTIFSGEVWRLFTYAFLHDLGSPMHVVFNALVFYMMGPQLEERWGEKRFLFFVVACILVGGIFVCLSFLFGFSNASVLGFSAVTLGMIIAWGVTFSTMQIYLLGILPLTGKQLVFLTIGLEILYAVSSNSISSAAHFGGIVTGIVFTLGLYKPRRIKQMWNQARMKRNLRRH